MSWFQRANMFVLFLGFLGGASSFARADAFSYSEVFSNFGQVTNFTCPASPGGVCGAVAAMNSFTFLQNTYSSIYGITLTGLNPAFAASSFASTGWVDSSGTAYQGYYSRPGTANGDFIATLQDWVNTHQPQPNLTNFSSWYAGSPNGLPTIDALGQEIKAQEDVEIFVKNIAGSPSFFHVLTLTAVSCDAALNCSIKYQDPNGPANEQTATLANGTLQFTGVPASGFAGTVSIVSAFSESPVPEPASYILFGIVTAVLLASVRRQRSRKGLT